MKNKNEIMREIRMALIKRENYKNTAKLLGEYICSSSYDKKKLIKEIGRSSISINVFTKIALMYLRKINYLKNGNNKLEKLEKNMMEEIDLIIPMYNPAKTYTEDNVPKAIRYETLVVEEIIKLEDSVVENFIDLICDWFICLEENTEDVICNNISKKVQLVIV